MTEKKTVKKKAVKAKPVKKTKVAKKKPVVVEQICHVEQETNSGGRPRIEIDFDTLDKLCIIQCTQVECAGFLDCSPDTLDRRLKEEYGIGFAEYFKQKSAHGKISLRRRQFAIAESGNPAMLIWLGKQWLGQRDQPADAAEGNAKIISDFINALRPKEERNE